MSIVSKHLSLLGKVVVDKVTGMRGPVTTVSFDLYGCVQATIHPGLDKEGKPREQHWFDVSRLEVEQTRPVMDAPNYDYTFTEKAIAFGDKGASEKPPTRAV